MCNLSESIRELGIEEGIKKGVTKERPNAIERMVNANFAKEQIISCGYTEEEFAEAQCFLCTNA